MQTIDDESGLVEVYECPIDGCNRRVVGDTGALHAHVRQSDDEAHRHRTLNEELEIVYIGFDWREEG